MDVLFIGLGNPGIKYKNNRHNVGFKIIDEIAKCYESSLVLFKQISSVANVVSFCVDDKKIMAAKPCLFMNLSGHAVRFLTNFYKIPLEKVYIFHDDIDLEFGRVKIKNGGGNGGHNGLKSIDSLVGRNYWRIRIGIDRPEEKSMIVSHVLGDFSKEEDKILQNVFSRISENIPLLLNNEKHLENELNKSK